MHNEPSTSGVVLLAGPGAITNIIYHALASEFGSVMVVMEQPVSRYHLVRRRIRRLGVITVLGQMLFMTTVVPLLVRLGRSRTSEIVDDFGFDPSAIVEDRLVRVTSVNSVEAQAALERLKPAVVVVSGTRIISAETLRKVDAPFVNMHTGITPQYRGCHGGYWALAERRPDLAGTTVHLVDVGIDTGTILGQSTFEVTKGDSFVTYPLLQAGAGLPLLLDVVKEITSGDHPDPRPPLSIAEPSRLRSHPTIWQYLAFRLLRSVK